MLEIKNLNKTYITKGAPPVRALVDVSVKLEHSGMVFVLGKSGSGKSTFLNVVGGLDKYDSGEIIIKGKSSKEFSDSDFDSYRNTYLGFVFQEYNLINEFSLGQNIGLAMELQSKTATQEDINGILHKVELDGLDGRMPLQISGGQRQRTAIARALIKNPEIIMADEPTGALDSVTGMSIFETLKELSRERLVIIVSHDREYAEIYGDRIIEFSDGRIVSDVIKMPGGFTEVSSELSEDDDEVKNLENVVEDCKKVGLSEAHIVTLTKLLDEKRQSKKTKKTRKKGTFIDTKEEMLDLSKGNNEPFALKKSKLPAKSALKMARSSLKHKKARLVVSIILSVMAIAMFGFSVVVSTFNEKNAIKSVIRDYGYQHMAVSKSVNENNFASSLMGSAQDDIAFSDIEIQKMSDATDGAVGRITMFGRSLPSVLYGQLEGNDNLDYYSNYVWGLVGCDDFGAMGLNVPPEYGRYPIEKNEILISNFTAQSIQKHGLLYQEGQEKKNLLPEDIKNITDILNYSISCYDFLSGDEEKVVKIVGIINFPIQRYEELKLLSGYSKASKVLKDEFEERKRAEISYIYCTSEFYDSLNYNREELAYKCQMRYDLPKMGGVVNKDAIADASQYISKFDSLQSGYFSNINYLGKDGSSQIQAPQKGQIILNLSEYVRYEDRRRGVTPPSNNYGDNYHFNHEQLKQYAEQFGVFDKKITASANGAELASHNKFYSFHSDKYEVIGVISTDSNVLGNHNYHAYSAFFSDEDYELMMAPFSAESLLVYLRDYKTAAKFVDAFVGESASGVRGINKNVTVEMPFAQSIYDMVSFLGLLAIIFLGLAVLVCIFAVLLLMNFISSSVNLKKKEIGILRAIGARKIDVVSIFLWEGGLIGAIVFAISILFTFISVVVLNNLLGLLMGVPFTLLVMGWLSIVLMALISFVAIALASILPSRKVAALKPMDAIRTI